MLRLLAESFGWDRKMKVSGKKKSFGSSKTSQAGFEKISSLHLLRGTFQAPCMALLSF
jgi:hypothetical protein